MNNNKILTFFLTGFIFLLSNISKGQSNEVIEINNLLRSELKKTNIDIPVSSIELSKVNYELLKKFDLSNKPIDAFHIKVKKDLISITSQSINGLRNGVYWYLSHLGYRYYFPGEAWEYVPSLETAYLPLERTISPSFFHRRIWYAYGTGSKQADGDYTKWFNANMLGGENISAGHSYDGIVKRNRSTFLIHPEFFAQKVEKGKIPLDPKFEVSNKRLVELVIKDALLQIENSLKKSGVLPDMISMDPSDGGGFSTSSASLKIGGPSEQTFHLANEVAKAVQKRYPGVRIGLYAYNLHAAPPDFGIEPNIVVMVATSLNQSAYRTDELIKLWQQKGITVGIRDYYGVMAWDWDMPGQPLGSKLSTVTKLRKFHQEGVRYFTAETNVGWISRGLGHYIASRLLWDVNTDIKKVQNEFYTNMFGLAAGKIEELFTNWENYKQTVPLDGDMYKWYQLIEDAERINTHDKVKERLKGIKIYLHYVYLYKSWRQKISDENLIQLLNYAYRIQNTSLVASYPLFRRIANAAVKNKPNMRFDDPQALWKRNKAVLSDVEIASNFSNIKKTFNKSDITSITKLPSPDRIQHNIVIAKANSPLLSLRGGHTVVFTKGNNNATINLANGLAKVAQYKTLLLSIYKYTDNLQSTEAVITEVIKPGKQLQNVSLNSLPPGSYMATINDSKNGFKLGFSGDVKFGVVANNERNIWTLGRHNLVFEVSDSKGFHVFNGGVITLVSPKGRIIDLQKKSGLIAVKVQPGEVGVWKIQRQSGVFYFQDITPFVSTNENHLIQIK